MGVLAELYRLHSALLAEEHWKEGVGVALYSEVLRALQDLIQELVEPCYSCCQKPNRRLAMMETSLLTASPDPDLPNPRVVMEEPEVYSEEMVVDQLKVLEADLRDCWVESQIQEVTSASFSCIMTFHHRTLNLHSVTSADWEGGVVQVVLLGE